MAEATAGAVRVFDQPPADALQGAGWDDHVGVSDQHEVFNQGGQCDGDLPTPTPSGGDDHFRPAPPRCLKRRIRGTPIGYDDSLGRL